MAVPAPSWMQKGQRVDMMGADDDDNVGAAESGTSYEGYGVKAEMTDRNMVRFGFRIAALVLGVMMIFASFVEVIVTPIFSIIPKIPTYIPLAKLSSFTRFSIALYNILFAFVLMLHESQGLVMCDGVDSNMRRHFGLLYGHMGRAIFIIFIAFLNFALTDAGWLGTFTGLLLLLLGAVMILIYTKYPHLLDDAPGLGDLKTALPRQEGYAPPPTMPSTSL